MLTIKTRTAGIRIPTFDARDIAAAGADELLDHLHESIVESKDPATGASRPLSESAQRKPGRAGGRGYDTGELADELTRTAPSGSAKTARMKIVPPRSRLIFLNSEAQRGYTYLTTSGLAGEALDKGIEAAIEEAVEKGKALPRRKPKKPKKGK